MLDADDIALLVIEPFVVSDPAFNVAVPSLKVALVIVADVDNEPDLRVAVPSVCVEPNTWPNAKILDADEITPLVIDPLVVNDPLFNAAVPSENVELVIVADVDNEPNFSVAVPSVNVLPNNWPSAEILEKEEMTPLVIDPAVVNDPL